jgi:hypothetical protein
METATVPRAASGSGRCGHAKRAERKESNLPSLELPDLKRAAIPSAPSPSKIPMLRVRE